MVLKVQRGTEQLDLTATLGWAPLQLLRPEFDHRPLLVADNAEHDPLSLQLRLKELDGQKPDKADSSAASPPELATAILAKVNWRGTQVNANCVEFVRELPQLKITKRYQLLTGEAQKTGYELRVELAFENLDAAQPCKLTYQLDGPNGMPIEGWWYAAQNRISTQWFQGLGLRDIACRFEGNDSQLIGTLDVLAKKTQPLTLDEVQAPLVYAGVDCQYFSAVLIPDRKGDSSFELTHLEPVILGSVPNSAELKRLVNTTCRLTGIVRLAPAGHKNNAEAVEPANGNGANAAHAAARKAPP